MTLLNCSQILLSTSNSKLLALFDKRDTIISIAREMSWFIILLFDCINFLSQKYDEQFS